MSNNQTVQVGATVLVQWENNPKSPGSVKSNRINDRRTKKIVLAETTGSGLRPKQGETWICRVERITNPKSETRGAIVVKPLTLQISYEFKGAYIDPDKARVMAIVLQHRQKNLFLEGDQGVGKTTISHAVAGTLGWVFRKVNCGLIKKFQFMLVRFIPHVQGGQMTYKPVDSALIEVIREAIKNQHKEYLCMLDEYTRMDEDARDALLEVIEGKIRELRLPTGEVLSIPNNIHFMAAGNVGEGFTLKREDAAAKDRWVIVKITHMPQDKELKHCVDMFPTCPKAEMDRALTIINRLRTVRHEPTMRLSKAVSTRASENVAMMLANGVAIELALETGVVNQFNGNLKDSTSEAGRVAKLISEELKKMDAKDKKN